ncbi:MAG: methyltransferase domain-containing protein [Nitrospira sp.]
MTKDKRFGFGKNWKDFLNTLDDERITEAEKSLKNMLGLETLKGKTFLDIGSGSGLFSLAAYRLGATVYSFDYDINSVECTKMLRERYAKNDPLWKVEQGSVLDDEYLKKIPEADVVYSWGVLHHTGNMYTALQNTQEKVKNGGTLFIAIYNDQGAMSRIWTKIKKTYHALPTFLRPVFVCFLVVIEETQLFIRKCISLKNPLPFKRWVDKKKSRGMSMWYDWVDWVGGYPFEVARPEQIMEPLMEKGFTLTKLITKAGGHGCNEYVFIKN